MISAMVITLRTAQASPITAAACALVPALDTITTRSADATSSDQRLGAAGEIAEPGLHRPALAAGRAGERPARQLHGAHAGRSP